MMTVPDLPDTHTTNAPEISRDDLHAAVKAACIEAEWAWVAKRAETRSSAYAVMRPIIEAAFIAAGIIWPGKS